MPASVAAPALISDPEPSLYPAEIASLVTRLQDLRDVTLKFKDIPWQERLKRARLLNEQLRVLEYRFGATTLRSLPSGVELPVAGKCNLRCTMCSLSFMDETPPNWTLDQVKRFEPFFPFARIVNPTGAGEPLSNRNFFDMLELFAAYQLAVGFYTNATLLTPDRIERILRLGVRQVNVSLDGATADTYNTIRRHASFDKVVANVRRFVTRRDELRTVVPKLQIAMVLMRENMHELPAMIRLAHDLGAASVYTMFVSDITPEKMCQHEPRRTNSMLREARQVAREVGISFMCPDELPETKQEALGVEPEAPLFTAVDVPETDSPIEMPVATGNTPFADHKGNCVMPWRNLVVWNDGEVSPCCFIRDEDVNVRFGSIHESDPTELWNSAGMVDLRRRLSTGDPPQKCIECTFRTASM